MKTIAILIPLLLSAAGSVVAKDGGKNSTSTKSQCAQVQKLTHLTELAANQTKLDKASKGNSTKAAEIQAKASDAATKLTTLESNATLMDACGQIFAVEAMDHSCEQMVSMEKQAALVANDTALQAHFKDNTTKIDAFKTKVADEATKLQSLQSNTTLTAFCSVKATEEQCATMNSLQKDIALANNDTALQAHFKDNTTKIDAFKTKAAKLQTKLDAMTSNTTLTDACASIKSSKTGNTQAAASGTSNGSTNAAVGTYQSAGTMVSLVALLMTALLVL